MPHPDRHRVHQLPVSTKGFSLVELLVAVLFTSILMAGMAKVFRSSVSAFAATSESMASSRKNRLAMDMLYDDLNQANQVASTLFFYPSSTTTNPPFIINPNVSFDPLSVTDIATAQAKTDQLIFYYDDVLPYDASLGTAIVNTSQQVASGGQVGDNASFTITLRDPTQAANAARLFTSYGLNILFRSSGYVYQLKTAVQNGSTSVLNVTLGADSSYTGAAVSGSTFTTGAPSGTGITLMRPGRYVRYSIRPLSLDPSTTVQTPCLVRDEVTYGNVSASVTPFATPDDSIIIAENVIRFKVMLSGDGGQNWAGSAGTEATWNDIAGVGTLASPTLNWQFQNGAAPARTGMNSTTTNPFWFREIPTLVRLDVTTRTLTKRSDYANTVATANTAVYQTQTQSLILTPRHSGLAYQPVVF
jgi:Tfp pilus assembly protein PilV